MKNENCEIVNCESLRDQLAEVFADLRAGTIQHKDAAELANLAGKMINSAKTQVEYYALRKESPTILFLASTDQPGDCLGHGAH